MNALTDIPNGFFCVNHNISGTAASFNIMQLGHFTKVYCSRV